MKAYNHTVVSSFALIHCYTRVIPAASPAAVDTQAPTIFELTKYFYYNYFFNFYRFVYVL